MAKLKTSEVLGDFSIYVLFHPTPEHTFEVEVQKVDDAMAALFGDTYEMVFSDARVREVTYRLQKPLLESTSEALRFFEDLRKLFAQTAELRPHFTQFYEGARS